MLLTRRGVYQKPKKEAPNLLQHTKQIGAEKHFPRECHPIKPKPVTDLPGFQSAQSKATEMLVLVSREKNRQGVPRKTFKNCPLPFLTYGQKKVPNSTHRQIACSVNLVFEVLMGMRYFWGFSPKDERGGGALTKKLKAIGTTACPRQKKCFLAFKARIFEFFSCQKSPWDQLKNGCFKAGKNYTCSSARLFSSSP